MQPDDMRELGEIFSLLPDQQVESRQRWGMLQRALYPNYAWSTTRRKAKKVRPGPMNAARQEFEMIRPFCSAPYSALHLVPKKRNHR